MAVKENERLFGAFGLWWRHKWRHISLNVPFYECTCMVLVWYIFFNWMVVIFNPSKSVAIIVHWWIQGPLWPCPKSKSQNVFWAPKPLNFPPLRAECTQKVENLGSEKYASSVGLWTITTFHLKYWRTLLHWSIQWTGGGKGLKSCIAGSK